MPDHRLAAICLAASIAALAGCATPVPGANPYPPVPPPQAETRPLAPISADPVTWQPGHWDWVGNTYVWTPGRWVPTAGHGPLWQPGFWTTDRGVWSWVPSHWS